MGEIDESGSP